MGTVLGFTKARAAYVTDKDSSDKMIYDSFFIYFDHLTGTVTRHLLNKERVNEAFTDYQNFRHYLFLKINLLHQT